MTSAERPSSRSRFTGGSGFSRTIQTIQELQPGADVVEDGLSISKNQVTDAQSDAAEWTASLNLS